MNSNAPVSAQSGNDVQLDLFGASHAPEGSPGVPSHSDSGAQHERRLQEQGTRKEFGSYYTPGDVVEGLLDLTLDPILEGRASLGIEAVKSVRVLDPSCGTGNFLLAAGRRIAAKLVSLGVPAPDANCIGFGECVVGVDVDAEAVDLCRDSLASASGVCRAEPIVVCADSLLMFAPVEAELLEAGTDRQQTWQSLIESSGCTDNGFELVIGNPPFLSQLGATTARLRQYGAQMKRRFGEAAGAYTDPAALFLLLSTRLASPAGGVVCLVEPQSVLSARDARVVRDEVLRYAGITGAWIADTRVFDAAVDVCAPILTKGHEGSRVFVTIGRDFIPVPRQVTIGRGVPSWSALLAAVNNLPAAEIESDRTIGEVATATADFRDQYYGLASHVLDSASRTELPRLITSGAIDPAELLWGTRAAKFNKVSYQFPRVVVDELEEGLKSWSRKRLVPKILLATQTKVLEAIVDFEGQLLPSVPVITITTDPAMLYRLAALLVSPPTTLVAAHRHLGAALSSDALKLSARDVLALPLPRDDAAWLEAGELFKRASECTDSSQRRVLLIRLGGAMCDAFEISDPTELLTWWVARLPKVRT